MNINHGHWPVFSFKGFEGRGGGGMAFTSWNGFLHIVFHFLPYVPLTPRTQPCQCKYSTLIRLLQSHPETAQLQSCSNLDEAHEVNRSLLSRCDPPLKSETEDKRVTLSSPCQRWWVPQALWQKSHHQDSGREAGCNPLPCRMWLSTRTECAHGQKCASKQRPCFVEDRDVITELICQGGLKTFSPLAAYSRMLATRLRMQKQNALWNFCPIFCRQVEAFGSLTFSLGENRGYTA